jgi:hypothetical protein
MAWPQNIRRWSGALYLAASILMLVAGVTVLEDRLKGFYFIYYWLICAMFTLLAFMIALLDFRAVRRRSQQAQTDLIRDVLHAVSRSKDNPDDDTRRTG